MKTYIITWETDYCEDFPELGGDCAVSANSADEAVKKFRELGIPKALIFNVEERN